MSTTSKSGLMRATTIQARLRRPLTRKQATMKEARATTMQRKNSR